MKALFFFGANKAIKEPSFQQIHVIYLKILTT
jgi:hypothetical protein